MEEPELQPEPPNKLQRFIKETFRVLRITKKPSKEEYQSLVKVTALGISLLGVIGLVIFLLRELVVR